MRHLSSWEVFEGKFDQFDNKAGSAFWGDAGAGILPICKSTGKILVAYRSEFVNEPHTYGVIGGKLDDPNEKPEDAAKRELHEELGYNGHFEIVPAYVFEAPNHTFVYHNFLGIVDEEFEAEVDWETEYAEWITLDELVKLKPKHFGLEALLKNSIDLIKKYAK